MLVFTRKAKQYVDLDMDKDALQELLDHVTQNGGIAKIRVDVVSVKGGTTRLGFTAPQPVHIKRGELPTHERNYRKHAETVGDVELPNSPNYMGIGG